RLAFDLRGELVELADAVLEHSEPVAQSRDAPAKARAAKEANDRVHRRERLLEARSLLHHALARLHEAGALLLDRIEPALALRGRWVVLSCAESSSCGAPARNRWRGRK